VQAALRRAEDWPAAQVGEAMSRPVLTIDASETLWDAWQLLSISGLRHLAVVDDDRCIGVISDRNILSDIPVSQERMRTRLVGQVVCSQTNRTVAEGEPLARVARIMTRHSLEAVPVVAGGFRLVGIVTGSDLVRWWAADGS
jgi:acetoin utilization protein AcuB